jgi:hypothetical protein
VVAARATADLPRERVRDVERQLYAGERADDTAARVSRLLVDPAATLTRAPAVTPDDLRDLRAARDEADREVERAVAAVCAKRARATLAERRERMRDLLDAAEHYAAMLAEVIAADNAEAAAGYAPDRAVFFSDHEEHRRRADRIRRFAEALGA